MWSSNSEESNISAYLALLKSEAKTALLPFGTLPFKIFAVVLTLLLLDQP
jgi:hypothetical protein